METIPSNDEFVAITMINQSPITSHYEEKRRKFTEPKETINQSTS